MNIVLLSEISFENKKEATYITLIDFAKKLKTKNNVFVICKGIKSQPVFEKIGGISVYRIPCPKFEGHLSQIIQIIKCLKKIQNKGNIKIDIIHNFSAAPILSLKGLIPKLLLKNFKIVHTMKSYSKKITGNLFYRTLNFVDVVTVPTKVFVNKLIKKGVKKERIRIIRSHIDLGKFIPMDKKKIKRKYGYANKKIVFYYGALVERKGFHSLVDAIRLLNEKNSNFLFLIAPRHELKHKVIAPIVNKARILENAKIITGDIDIVDYLNIADLVVLPYKEMIGTEGNPSCLLEAMACKTPVVTSDLPELREIVEPGKDVLMTKPGDIFDLARNIGRLLGDRKLSKKLAENAYKKSKQFDVRKITKQFIRLYEELSNGS